MKKRLVALGLIMTMIFMLAGCGSSDSTNDSATATTESSETTATADAESLPLSGQHFVIGINATFAPFEYVASSDSDGNEVLEGFDIDLIEKFSEMLGFTYEFDDMEFNGLIGAISSDRCDLIISGISMTDERAEVVDGTDAYFEPRTAILSYQDNEYTDLQSLVGKTVAVSFGTTYASIAESQDGVDVKELDSTALAFQDLSNKTVDACVFDANQAQTFIDDNPDMNLVRNMIDKDVCDQYQSSGYSVLVPKGNTELLDDFNQAIDEIQENGWLDDLITKWCGEDYLAQ